MSLVSSFLRNKQKKKTVALSQFIIAVSSPTWWHTRLPRANSIITEEEAIS